MGKEQPKKEPVSGVELRSFAFWSANQIFDLSASSVVVGSVMQGGVSGFVTSIVLVDDLVLFDVCADLDGRNPRQFIVHASSGWGQVARAGECEEMISKQKALVGG